MSYSRRSQNGRIRLHPRDRTNALRDGPRIHTRTRHMSDPERPRRTIKLEDFIPYQLSVTAGTLSVAISDLFERKYRIQIPEWRILMTLAEYGPLSAFEVADKSSMDRARVSRAQRRMTDLGLVVINIDEMDRRRTILELTPAGWEIVETIVPDADHTGDWLLAALSEEEQAQLKSLLNKLLRRTQELQDRGGFSDLS